MSADSPSFPYSATGSYGYTQPQPLYQPGYPPQQPQPPYQQVPPGYTGGAYFPPPPPSPLSQKMYAGAHPQPQLQQQQQQQSYGYSPSSPSTNAPFVSYDGGYQRGKQNSSAAAVPFPPASDSRHGPVPPGAVGWGNNQTPAAPQPAQQETTVPLSAALHAPSPSREVQPRPRAVLQPSREEIADAAAEEAAQRWQQQQHYGHLKQWQQQPQDLLGGDLDDSDTEARLRAMQEAGARQFTLPKTRPRDVEFLVGSPRYRLRTTLLFATALFGVIPLMSSFAFTVLLCGIAVVYISDYLGSLSGTIYALVGTAVTFGVALLLSNLHAAVTSFGPMLMVVDLSGVMLMATLACLLHFRWFQETRPEVVCMLERCVLGITPILALPSILTTIIALTGSRYGPFFFLVAMCAIHQAFYGPLKSSFLMVAVRKRELGYFVERPREEEGNSNEDSRRGRGPVPQDDIPAAMGEADENRVALVPQQLNERTEAVTFTILLLLLPPLLYNVIQTNWEDNLMGNLLNTMGLWCGAMTYLCMTPAQSLWFLSPPREQLLRALDAGTNNPAIGTPGAASTEDGQGRPAGVNPETVALLLEYDPLGLQTLIAALRTRVLLIVCALGINWAAYRLTNSRYAYLFDGIPYPYNFAFLLIALGVAALLAVEVFVLVSADEAGKDVTRGQYVARRASVALGSIVVVVLFCTLTAAPGVFYFLGVLSMTSLNVFLIDRTNAGPMVSFTIFSSLLLLWWMYRTFSFVVVDLRVLNGTGAVSSSLVAVSVLWSYVLGCIVFMLSFSKNKAALVVMVFLHATELTFVEEVLIAQKDDGAYPAVLVFFTSGVGALVGYRFYRNEVLGIQGASFVASCYLVKILTLFVETTNAYYAAEGGADEQEASKALLVLEVSGAWWGGLIVCYVLTLFEIEQQKKLVAREAARLPYVYIAASLVVTLCTLRNVQRAAYEFVTQSFVASTELPHIVLGTGCLTFALLIGPFFMQQSAERYPSLKRFATLGKLSGALGVLLLAVQPTRIVDTHVSGLDYEMAGADKGRYASAFGLTMLLAVRFLPLRMLPVGARAVYWLTASTLLAFGITAQLLPVPTLPLFGCMVGFVFLMLLLVDLAHYRELTSIEGWVVYGLSFCVMIGSFAMIGRVDLQQAAKGNVPLMWEMHEQGRMQLLSIISVVNLFVAALLKCRLSGRALLPRCVSLTPSIASQVGVMCNYATLFSVCTLGVLNSWGKQNDPWMFVFLSPFLLLLVDDDMLFFDLHRGDFRYFPCTAFAFGALWYCQLSHGWALGAGRPFTHRIFLVGRTAVEAVLVLPSQVFLLKNLWDSGDPVLGRKGAAVSAGRAMDKVAIASLVVSVLVLLFTSSFTVTCMAMTCVCGQCARIFGSAFTRAPVRHRKPSVVPATH